jgi:hypothetical protein
MLLGRQFAHRRATFIAATGLLGLAIFFALPQGQVAAATLLSFFRGQQLQGVATTVSDLKNAQSTFSELEHLGSVQGSLPSTLQTVGSIDQARSMAGFGSVAQPRSFPSGINGTPTAIKALAPSQLTITFNKAQADAYFQQLGSNLTLPAQYDGAEMVFSVPGVSVIEYSGSAKLFVGQAGQGQIQVAPNTINPEDLKSFLLQMPGLSANTATALRNLSNWQTTIPLGVPTDKVSRWNPTSVGGGFPGNGVFLNDNTGLGSAVIWQATVGTSTETLGVAGYGLTANDVQSVAGSLH